LIFTSIRKYRSLKVFFCRTFTGLSSDRRPRLNTLLFPFSLYLLVFRIHIYLKIFKISLLLFGCCVLISRLAPQEIDFSLQWLVHIYLLLPLQSAVKVFVCLCSPSVSILTANLFFLCQVLSFSIVVDAKPFFHLIAWRRLNFSCVIVM